MGTREQLAELREILGAVRARPRDVKDYVTATWSGTSDGRLAFIVYCVVEVWGDTTKLFDTAWNAVAESRGFSGVPESVDTADDERPPGAKNPASYVSFTVLGCRIDSRGV